MILLFAVLMNLSLQHQDKILVFLLHADLTVYVENIMVKRLVHALLVIVAHPLTADLNVSKTTTAQVISLALAKNAAILVQTLVEPTQDVTSETILQSVLA